MRLVNPLARLSLRGLLLLMLATGATTLSVLVVLAWYHHVQWQVRQDGQQHLRLLAMGLRQSLEQSQAHPRVDLDPDAKVQALNLAFTAPRVEQAFVARADGRVLLAHRRPLAGRAAGELDSDWSGDQATMAIRDQRPHLVFTTGGQRLLGYFPLHWPQAGTAAGSPPALLFLSYDTGLHWDTARPALLQLLWIIWLPVVLMAVAIHAILNRHVRGRVQRLVEAARRLAGGDLTARSNVGGNDEISALAEAFNTMARSLEQEVNHRRLGERRYHRLFELINEPIFQHGIDPGQPFVRVNAAACRVTGWSRRELLARTPAQLFGAGVADGYLAALAALAQGQGDQKTLLCEDDLARRDGSTLPVELAGTLVRMPREGTQVVSTARDVSQRRHQENVLRSNNHRLQDRVDELHWEKLDRERLLVHQSRMASMGQMIAAIAHQWQQPLTAISLLFDNLEISADYGELQPEQVAGMVTDGRRLVHNMTQTMRDFRDFFRPDKEARDFPLRGVVDSALGLVGASLSNHGFSINVREENPGLAAHGQANELAQVIICLLVNAREAADTHDVPSRQLDIELMRRDGRCELAVTDSCGGIPESVLPRLFDCWFTTKAQGSGVGLYLSRMIMQGMGGDITVRNVSGGARFTLHLPEAGAPDTVRAPPSGPDAS